MKQRDKVAMTTEEAASFLAAGRKVQLATNGHDGFPHLVTMYYVMSGGHITFWTYRRSQKALNLERDPRISCLVEEGEEYFDLRGVLVQGEARRIEDPDEIAGIGHQITAVVGGALASAGADALTQYVEHAARKRWGYRVIPDRVISWDHAKLVGG
ncbi:MAG: pyridoxamine 5'-phosphate oxidase family protein [Nocardiopsaceae bacterium]|jgi:nitroimidazol reductase NimA-like FMN-containing flavoprotein (pyridoxamine 5'-phosphate oxidase superfamily)|nr:pyridoxamine 5'-phosphate oxidase family protein [Nocardiopsaceae bacterium]